MARNLSKSWHVPRLLLIEANDMPRWVGGSVPLGVHVVPVGLMYVAAAVRAEGAASELRIVESSLQCPTDEALIDLLDDFRPDVVGIRSIIFFGGELQRIASLVRSHTGAKIVVGGPIVAGLGSSLLRRVPEIDVAVKGEGERVLPSLLRGQALAEASGTIYREGDRILETPSGPEIDNLDSLPFPAYDLIDLDLYSTQLSYAYNHRRQGVLVTSRGCVYSCTFCFRSWERLRLRSAESVFGEIVFLYDRYGIRDFYIVDDIFNVSQRRAIEIFDRIIGSGLEIRLYFVNGLRADMVTETFLDKAVEAGAIWFTYAVESASQEIQRLTKKNVDLDKARRTISRTQQMGVAVNISTMYGFPGETVEQAQMTLDWLGTLPKPSLLPYHFCVRFFPGCEIVEQARAAGWSDVQLKASAEFCYHDLPDATPTMSRSTMVSVLVEYHKRFGTANRASASAAVRTLRDIGYSEREILNLYSILKRRPLTRISELADC